MNVQVAYVGNTARKLYIQRDANTPAYIAGKSTVSNVNSRRPYLPGTFGAVYQAESAANADYNSLQVTFTRRFSRGFSVLANYTYSKSIDLVSDDPSQHAFSLSWVRPAPAVHYAGWLGKQVIGGWQLNGIMTAQSGQPFNITARTAISTEIITTVPIWPAIRAARAIAATPRSSVSSSTWTRLRPLPVYTARRGRLATPRRFCFCILCRPQRIFSSPGTRIFQTALFRDTSSRPPTGDRTEWSRC